MKKCTAFFLCICLCLLTAGSLFPHSGEAQPADKKEPETGKKEEEQKKKKDKSLSLTMFIPGIYQIQKRRYVKGVLFLGAFAGCVAGTIGYNNNGNYWYEKYSNATTVDDVVRYREITEKRFKTRNYFIAGIFTVWLAHLLDVKLFKSSKSGVTSNVGQNHLSVGLYHTF